MEISYENTMDGASLHIFTSIASWHGTVPITIFWQASIEHVEIKWSVPACI